MAEARPPDDSTDTVLLTPGDSPQGLFLGSYRLERRLGQGGMGEAQAAAGLNHPAIVQVHDLVEDASGLAIVMEHVEGRTLADHLEGGPLALPLALRLAREIAEGLAAAHAARGSSTALAHRAGGRLRGFPGRQAPPRFRQGPAQTGAPARRCHPKSPGQIPSFLHPVTPPPPPREYGVQVATSGVRGAYL